MKKNVGVLSVREVLRDSDRLGRASSATPKMAADKECWGYYLSTTLKALGLSAERQKGLSLAEAIFSSV